MSKKGFVLVETIIVLVILLSSLVLLYATISSSILREKQLLYYDDVSYIYKTQHIKEFLEDNRVDLKSFTGTGAKYFIFDVETLTNKCPDPKFDFCTGPFSSEFNQLKELYHAFYFIYVPIDKINVLKNDPEFKNNIKIFSALTNDESDVSDDFITDYVKKLNQDDIETNCSSAAGILIAVYFENKSGTKNGYNMSMDDDDNFYNYDNCINYYKGEKPNKEISELNMQCEKAINIAWVYYDEK